MLRAALIGFGQTGKTTLFQLMTSAREAARAAHGKGEATIGISKVPDGRLDRLTAMYNPKKRVPATIEFSDLATPVRAGAAQAMEDELILADLGVAERRLERLEKDLKKSRTADLERERDVVTICRTALEEGRPLRSLDLQGDDLKRLRGFQFLSAKPLLIVINLDESHVSGNLAEASAAAGLTQFLSRAATGAVAVCAKIELEIAQLE